MNWAYVAIILSVGNFVAWMVAIYVPSSVRGLLGHVLASTLGAFVGGYAALATVPHHGVVGLLPASLVGSVVVLYLIRFRKWRWQK